MASKIQCPNCHSFYTTNGRDQFTQDMYPAVITSVITVGLALVFWVPFFIIAHSKGVRYNERRYHCSR
jgi:hypothetical protein